MTDARHLVLHTLGVLKTATATDLARRSGLPEATVSAVLEAAHAGARVAQIGPRWTLSPLARLALAADYSRFHAETRCNGDVIAANNAFEQINVDLKALITDWQVVTVAGQRLPNDHSDPDHDAAIIDRLGKLHDRADPILARLEQAAPHLAHYRSGLLAALERAEDGDLAWVSDAGVESYHTLWFELHEELIRILGGNRTE